MTSAVLAAPAAGEGFHIPPVIELFTFVPFFSFDVAGITFNVTLPMVVMFGLSLLLFTLFVGAFARPKLVPTGLQNTMEAGVDLIRTQIAAPVLGHDADRWLPYLTSLFFFTFSLNIMSIVPPINFPITSRIAIPAMLSILTYVIFNVVGIWRNGPVTYFKANLFPSGVPWPIYIILTPIELFSTFIIRPITLTVRLFANMMAGHVLLAIVFLASAYFLYRTDALFLRLMSPIPIIFSVVIVVFEFAIGLIQAYVITILTAVYIAGASHAEH